MAVRPDPFMTTTEGDIRRMIWASTFGYVHWYVRNAPDNELRGDVSKEGRRKLYDFAKSQAVNAADEAAAAYEEILQKARAEDTDPESSFYGDTMERMEACQACDKDAGGLCPYHAEHGWPEKGEGK